MSYAKGGLITGGESIAGKPIDLDVTYMDLLRAAAARVERAEEEVIRAKSALSVLGQSVGESYGPFKRGDRVLYRGEKGAITQCGCTWDSFLDAPRWGVVICLDSEDVEFQLWGGELAGLSKLTHPEAS